MRTKTMIALMIAALGITQALAQATTAENVRVAGRIIDSATNLPLAYANVGIADKPFGTLADTTGHFSFLIGEEMLADTIQISLVGYHSIRLCVKDFLTATDKSIKLTVRYEQLSDVVILGVSNLSAVEIIGRQKVNKLVQVSLHNKKSTAETIGSELGMRYQPKNRNAVLQDFNFYISSNNFDHIRFRINIYSIKNDMPDSLLYYKQIFATVDSFKTGWIKINLEEYDIRINNEFILAIQWIESKMEKNEKPVTILPIAATPLSKNCFVRVASQDKWKRMGIQLSSFVRIRYRT